MKAIKLTKQAHERRQAARAKRKPLDIDALVAEAVPPRPNPQLAFTMPVRVDSHTNSWQGWKATWAKQKKQKEALFAYWRIASGFEPNISLPCVVRLIRIGQKKLDGDNLQESFKAIRDQLAFELGTDDGDERIKWEYEQVAVGKRAYAVRVEVY